MKPPPGMGLLVPGDEDTYLLPLSSYMASLPQFFSHIYFF